MSDQGKTFVGVAAVILAIGAGLYGGRVYRDGQEQAAQQRAVAARIESERQATAARERQRNTELARTRLMLNTTGAIPGIGVCASQELTGCELRYGDPTRTLVWRVARIEPPQACENMMLAAGLACASMAGDASVQQFGGCFMQHGWMPLEQGIVGYLDLREEQTPPGLARVQCDQGYYEGRFTPSP